MKATLGRAGRLLWMALAALIILAALFVSLGRQYIPQITNFQRELVAELNERTGLSLSVVNLENGGAIWHMVDLVWVLLFPVVYLLG